MDRRHPRRDRGQNRPDVADDGYRLSASSARRVVEDTGPAAPPPPRFLSTDHLSSEAAAAFVDGALPATGEARARAHLARCRLCRDEVEQQRQARQALRRSGPIRMPDDLRERLARIADDDAPRPRSDRPDGHGRRAGSSAWARWLRGLGGGPR